MARIQIRTLANTEEMDLSQKQADQISGAGPLSISFGVGGRGMGGGFTYATGTRFYGGYNVYNPWGFTYVTSPTVVVGSPYYYPAPYFYSPVVPVAPFGW